MASTNPFPHADAASAQAAIASAAPGTRRLRTHGSRANARAKAKRDYANSLGESAELGLPDWEGLRPIVSFLMVPASFAVVLSATGGGWPPALLYGIAGLIGLFVAFSTLRNMEVVFACLIFYIPFSKTIVISIAPMVNGTNMLIALALFATFIRASDKRQFWFGWPPGATLVLVFALFTMYSAVTVLKLPGGFEFLRYDQFLNYKSWVDQFVLFFIALCCIRDEQSAKRAWVYLCLGSIAVVLYSVPEMFEKMGRSSIDKSRIGGPHAQSNNFGGFVAYSSMPIAALFLVYIKQLHAWLITPYFVVMLKILITTFSRGAYLAFAAGALLAGYLKSGRFLLYWSLFSLSLVVIFPQVLPESVLVRLQSISADKTSSAEPERLDRSSEVRLIMWRAGARMIIESPIMGKGFKAFEKIKGDYTEQWVHESDPHSMYLYLGSQMGLPAVVLFVYIMGFSVFMGMRLAYGRVDRFSRAVGIGGAAAAVCYGIVCIFGSRAVNPDFTMYFWTYFVVLAVLYRDVLQKNRKRANADQPRQNAFVVAQQQQQADAEALAAQNGTKLLGRGSHRRKARRTAEPEIDSSQDTMTPRQQHIHARATSRVRRQSVKERLSSRRSRQ